MERAKHTSCFSIYYNLSCSLSDSSCRMWTTLCGWRMDHLSPIPFCSSFLSHIGYGNVRKAEQKEVDQKTTVLVVLLPLCLFVSFPSKRLKVYLLLLLFWIYLETYGTVVPPDCCINSFPKLCYGTHFDIKRLSFCSYALKPTDAFISITISLLWLTHWELHLELWYKFYSYMMNIFLIFWYIKM